MLSLEGRRALVTGGGRGIGLGIARGLAGAGADLILLGRESARLEEAGKSIESGGRAIGTVILNLLFTSLAAYPFAKMKFRGRDVIFYLLLATFIVPPQLTYIPSYVLAVNVFRYYDTIMALIFPSLATVFNIFLLRQAFKSVPDDLIDAGRIDGAGEFRIWWSILLPIVRPSLATAAIITFVNQWNDFFWPLVVTRSSRMFTPPAGIVYFADAEAGTKWSIIMAAAIVIIMPLIVAFLLGRKQFIESMTHAAIKG